MSGKPVKLYVFSGTGNTLIVALKVAEILWLNEVSVKLFRMEKSIPEQTELGEAVLGLAFPVACWASYPTVTRFIERLPEGYGREVFMLATYERFTAGMQGPIKKILLKKGYRPTGAAFFKMPGNFLARPIADEERVSIVEAAMTQATRFAVALAQERTGWANGLPLLSNLLYRFSKTTRPWNAVKKRFPIDLNKAACIRCGRCYRLCPSKSIAIPDTPLIRMETCEACRRCVRFCPTHALTISKKQAKPYNNFSYDDFMRAFK